MHTLVLSLLLCAIPSPCHSDPIQPVQCSPTNVSSAGVPACLSSPLLSPPPDRTIQVGGEDHPAACLSVCSAVHGEDTLAMAVLRLSTGLSCVCLEHLPDTRHLGPEVYCDRVCQGMQCGGHTTYENTSTDYYSLYCVDASQGMMGVHVSLPAGWVGTNHHPHTGSHSTILHQISNLNTESVVIAGLLAAILVFLMLVLVFMYFHKQDQLHDDRLGRKGSKIPILNSKEKSYGSNNLAYDPEDDEEEIFTRKEEDYKKEGKSKFYNVDSEELPEETREGKSKFYHQTALDTKTPEKEGFQEIFSGDAEQQDQVTLSEK